MADEKKDPKDLTGIQQYAAALEKLGNLPPAPEGAVMEEVPVETIDQFESLEDYAVSHPVAAPSNPGFDESPAEPALPVEGLETLAPEFAMSPDAPPSHAPGQELSELSTTDFPTTPAEDPSPENQFATPGSSLEFAVLPPEGEDPQPSEVEEFVLTPPPLPSALQPPFPTPASALAPEKKDTAIESIRRYSEAVSIGKPSVPAAFPFSLLILGHLTAEEKEKLLDLFSRENMGIRQIDLDPQFAGDRILIPRISEYAGIAIVHALKGARVEIRLGPSDSIFSTADTRSVESEDDRAEKPDQTSTTLQSDASHPADQIPVVAEDRPPSSQGLVLLDTISASATLKAKVVEAESTAEYQELVEALQQEIRYKAFRRGAEIVVHFRVQLTTLSTPTHYRLSATGTAARFSPSASLSPGSDPRRGAAAGAAPVETQGGANPEPKPRPSKVDA